MPEVLPQHPLTITAAAAEEIQSMLQHQKEHQGKPLRIYIEKEDVQACNTVCFSMKHER